MELIQPKALEKGATIEVVTPSSALLPDQILHMNANVSFLERVGYRVKFSKHFDERYGLKAGKTEKRVEDLMNAFENDDVEMIIAGRGGYNSNELLPHLDYNAIRRNPKIFCGFSDVTFLHLAINKLSGLTTFYGPNIAIPYQLPWEGMGYTYKCLFDMVSKKSRKSEIKPSTRCTSNYYTNSTVMQSKVTMWKTLRSGKAEGELLGGHLLAMTNLAGTEYFPSFKDKILFWEDTDSSTAKTNSFLTHLSMLGAFDEIKGMLVGRINEQEYRIDDDEYALHKLILDVTEGYDFPIIADMDFGHSVPMFTLPYGIRASMAANGSKPSLTLLESAVS